MKIRATGYNQPNNNTQSNWSYTYNPNPYYSGQPTNIPMQESYMDPKISEILRAMIPLDASLGEIEEELAFQSIPYDKRQLYESYKSMGGRHTEINDGRVDPLMIGENVVEDMPFDLNAVKNMKSW